MAEDFLIIGNFKQAGDMAYVRQLISALQLRSDEQMQGRKVVLLPPVPYLFSACLASRQLSTTDVGVQMVGGREGGSWTGSYHAKMVAELGGSYVCIGHSERRQKCHEPIQVIASQYQQTVLAGLRPILCVGETMSERELGVTFSVLKQQLSSVFSTCGFEKLPKHDIIVAYEPIWAIGAKQAADIVDVEKVFLFLQDYLGSFASFRHVSLCYGGSVDETNCQRFYAAKYISGLLVGRACLDIGQFMGVIAKCSGS